MYGRRPVYLISTSFFVVLTIPCALAPTLSGVIVARFFAAVAGSGAIALSPGTISDIANDDQRALAYSVWSIGPFTAPAVGPVIGGYIVEGLDWRWISWIIVIGAGTGLLWTFGVKESYAPVLIRKITKRKRKESGDERWWCRFDDSDGIRKKLATNLRRPFVLAATEPILWFWNLYIGLIYGLLYLSFSAYPTVFSGLHGWTVSQ